MERAEMVRLIVGRHQRLRSIREQAANGNQQQVQLVLAALTQLIEHPDTHPQAYQQITQLIVLASTPLIQTLNHDLIPRIATLHSNPTLDQHLILWARCCHGVEPRDHLPNLTPLPRKAGLNDVSRPLSVPFQELKQEFEKNFNQRNDERVEFFEDFDDELESETMGDESRLSDIIHMDTLQIRAARDMLTKQPLTEEAQLEQVNKLRHLVGISAPTHLPSAQRKEFEEERAWAQSYLQGLEGRSRVSINQTFELKPDEQSISIVDKSQFKQKRTMQGNEPNKMAESSFSIQPDRVEVPVYKATPVYKASRPDYKASPGPGTHMVNSGNSSLYIQDKSKASQEEELKENMDAPDDLEPLVVHKYKPAPQKQAPPTSPKRFAATEEQFASISSPRETIENKHKTAQQWGFSSPNRGKCRLSQFTSQKKQRRQVAPRQELSLPQQYAIVPYLQQFEKADEFYAFRRNCFQPKFTLWVWGDVRVDCQLQRQVSSQLRIRIAFLNQGLPLQVQVVYKIPKCFAIQKNSQISKRFTLRNHTEHIFTLDVEEFPIEPCLMSLAVRREDGQEGKKEVRLPLPLTILNFVEFLGLREEEWVEEWGGLLGRKGLFWLSRHFEADRKVVEEGLSYVLGGNWFAVGQTQGYSVQDYGCCCYYGALDQLRFLLRLSVRVDSLVSIEAISCRPLSDTEEDFVRYCVNMWMTLLARLHF